MTPTTAATRAVGRAGKAGVTPDSFMQQMTRFVRAGRAEDAAALFDRHSTTVLDALSDSQRTLLDALMEYVDTVIDVERAAGREREQARGREGAGAWLQLLALAPGLRIESERRPWPRRAGHRVARARTRAAWRR